MWIPYNPKPSPVLASHISWLTAGKQLIRCNLGTRATQTLGEPKSVYIEYDKRRFRVRASEVNISNTINLAKITGKATLATVFASTSLARLVQASIGEKWPWHEETEDGITWVVVEPPITVGNE